MARRHWHLPQEAHIVLFCSQKVTDERKGMRYLTEALARVDSSRLNLVVAGRDARSARA